MVFLAVGFWWHCLMATLMQPVFRWLTVILLLRNIDILPLFSPGYRRHLHWQEMSLHWKCLHSWPYSLWSVQHALSMLQWFSIKLFPSQHHPCFSYTNATLTSSSVCLNVARYAFYFNFTWLYIYTVNAMETWCLDYFLSLPCKWCFITMVFQTPWVLRIPPNGNADVVKWRPLTPVFVFKSLWWV